MGIPILNLNKGQKQKLLKNDKARQMFEKFHVRIDEEAKA